MKVKSILCLMSIIFLCSCSSVPVKHHADPGDIVAEFPEMTVGDSWETTDYSSKYGSDTYKYKITAVEKNKSFELRVNIEKLGKTYFLYQDIEQNSIRAILFSDADLFALNFPLFIGKSWESKQSGVSRSSNKGYDFSSIYLVESYESVKTDAGTFNAFKIKRKSHNITVDYRDEVLYWYSPDVKGVIKSQVHGRRGVKLIRYNLMK